MHKSFHSHVTYEKMYTLFVLILVACNTNGQCILKPMDFALLEQDILEHIRKPILQLIEAFLEQTQKRIVNVDHAISQTEQNHREAYESLSGQLQELKTNITKLNLMVEKRCPPPWVKFRTKCYRVVNTPANYTDAKARCEICGAYLSVPLNDDENSFVAGLTTNATFIDVTANRYRVFIDAHSDQPITYSKFYRDEPNNYGGDQSCVQINYKTGGYWDDVSCMRKLKYICQMSF